MVGLVLAQGDFAPELFQQLTGAQSHARVGRQCFEEPQVSLREPLMLEGPVRYQQIARLRILPLQRGHESLGEASLPHGRS